MNPVEATIKRRNNSRSKIAAASAFLIVFCAHMGWHILRLKKVSSVWSGQSGDFLSDYFAGGSYFVGYSYGLAGALAVYGLVRFLQNGKRGLKGVAGGITVGSALYIVGCFLIGCCGSPMLPVYLSVFGSSYAGFTKPLTAALTTIFVGAGYAWMDWAERKKGRKDREFFKRQLAKIEEIASIKKCSGCSCYYDILKEYRQGISRLPGNRDLKRRIEELIRSARVEHECFGCDPCHPVGVSNDLFEHGAAADSFSCCPACCETEGLLWPVEPGDYIVGRKNAPVAVVTLTSAELAQGISQNIGMQNIAIAGKMETENIGIEKVVKNIVSNPCIRFLILCGKDGEGHQSGLSLLALKEWGMDENKRVNKSPGLRPVLRNLHHDEIQSFREQITVIDRVGIEAMKEIEQAIKTCMKESSQPYLGVLDSKTSQRIRAKKPGRLLLDKKGFFVIIVDNRESKIVLEHYENNGARTKVIEGEDAVSIFRTAIECDLLSQLDHAAYLGRELTRAETALINGLQYVQDRAAGEVEPVKMTEHVRTDSGSGAMQADSPK